jgi:hypothetical protein
MVGGKRWSRPTAPSTIALRPGPRRPRNLATQCGRQEVARVTTERGRRSLILPALLGLALVAPAASAGATQAKRYKAWEAAGDPAVPEFTDRRGSCNSSSFVNPRRDAWRCFVGSRIHDPCFENPGFDRQVICVASPWARTGVLVTSRLDPDDRFPPGPRRPWALGLVNGRGCVFVSGATNVVRGRRLNYVCRLRPFRLAGPPFLFGLPDRSRSTWTILLGRGYEPARLERVKIRAAWQ